MAATTARLPGVTFETWTPSTLSPLPRMDIAGFVGFSASGPIDVPVPVEDVHRFHDVFGEDLRLAADGETRQPVYAELPAAVRAFFRNGGARCWVVRVAGPTPVTNRFVLPGLLKTTAGAPGVGAVLALARSPGSWSDRYLANTTVSLTPLAVRATSVPPGYAVGGLKPGDLVQLDYPDRGMVAFQAVAGQKDRRPPLTVDVPTSAHWFRRATRADVDPFPTSPPPDVAWLTPPVAVRWLTGAVDPPIDPVLPIARWGADDDGFIVELDRSDLEGVQPGSWLQVQVAVAPSGATPFLLLEVGRLRASADGPTPASPEPVWVTARGAWWVLDATQAALAVDGLEPRASVATFELWAREPVRGISRLADLGLAPAAERYWGLVPDDELLFRHDARRPARLDEVSPSLRADVDLPRFPLAAPRLDPVPSNRPVYLPLGMTALADDDRYQAALASPLAALERDGLATFGPALFVDHDLDDARPATLMAEAFQIQYVNDYDDPWQDQGRALTGMHALVPIDEVSLVAVPDALQRPWKPDASVVTPLDAPDLLEVSAGRTNVRVAWTLAAASPPDERLTYEVQASLDPRFSAIARTWTVNDLDLDHDVDLFRGCPTPVFYRVRARSSALGAGPWSNTRWEALPPSVFERCPAAHPPAPAWLTVTETAGRLVVKWDAVAGDAVAYTLEQAADPEFASGARAYAGPRRSCEVLRGAEPVVYFRVTADADGRTAPWSATVRVGVLQSEAHVTTPAADYDERVLVAVQTAAIRLSAARGDLHAVLGLPRHFRDEDALGYVDRLARAFADEDPRVLSYASVFHPWVIVRETAGRADLSTWSIAPDGPIAGTIAARTLRAGAWYSTANQPIAGAIALDPPPADAIPRLLDGRVNPLWQQPAGFSAVDALTLYPGGELGELHVRRLLILLRRLAVREGATLVFRPNDDSLRRLVRRQFEQVLGDLFVRGAFAGAAHDEGYRVVVDERVNTPQSLDLGRFIVELRVAPSQPLTFLTVRLVQEGGGLLAVEGS